MKRIALGLAALIGMAGLAHAAGQFTPGLPIVGGASYCQGTSTGPSGTPVCTVTVPAGPSALTGSELLGVDTGFSAGAQPQSAAVPMAAMGAGPAQFASPLTATSVTVSQRSRYLLLTPAGTIAALTVVFPAATLLVDNQVLGLCSTQVVTALTITPGTGTSVLNTVTALAIPPATGSGTCYAWTYRKSNTSWYRVQ